MKREAKKAIPLIFIGILSALVWVFITAFIAYTVKQLNAIEQETTALKQSISALEEQIFDLRSKMPQNQPEVLGEDLPTEEKEIKTDEDSKVSRGTERNLGTPVLMRVTCYDLSYESCKKNPDHPEYGIGASGIKVTENHSVAAGPEIPFGTKVFIPAFKDKPNGGIYTVEDRGKAIKENCLDIFLGESKHDECVEFGVQYLDVFVLDDLHESR